MAKVLVRRLGGAIPVLLVLALVVFILRQIAPIDQVASVVGENASPEVYAQARQDLGLNDPLPQQYLRYVSHTARGDLGRSTLSQRPISKDLGTFLPATLELVAVTFFLILALGVLLGMATAQHWRGSGFLRVGMVFGGSVPTFLLALLGMLLFYRRLGWLPATGRTSIRDAPRNPTGLLTVDGLLAGRFDVVLDALKHLVLPAACMAIRPAVSVGRVLRSSLQHTLRSDHIRTARVKGLGEKRILIKHALRNSSAPVLVLWGLELASLFGSTIVVESIFAFPGLGLFTTQAIARGDFNTIAAVTMVLGLLYVLANTFVDLLQVLADPRVRL